MSYGDNAPKLEATRTTLENILAELGGVARHVSQLDINPREGETYTNWHDTEAHKSLLTDTILVRHSIVGMLRSLDQYESTGHFRDKER